MIVGIITIITTEQISFFASYIVHLSENEKVIQSRDKL